MQFRYELRTRKLSQQIRVPNHSSRSSWYGTYTSALYLRAHPRLMTTCCKLMR